MHLERPTLDGDHSILGCQWLEKPAPPCLKPGASASREGGPESPEPNRSAALADLVREQVATDAVLAAYQDLGTPVGQRGIAVRELWVHRIEEYARHCGHADLLRECIDGRVGQ